MGVRTGCRHLGGLSERRIREQSTRGLWGKGEGWLCLGCFRECEGRTSFVKHGRSHSHHLAWVIPEDKLYCVACSAYSTADDAKGDAKTRWASCFEAIKELLSKPKPQVSVVGGKGSLDDPIDKVKESLKTRLTDPPDETPAKRKRPVGLRNLGNTCFMNSTLQSLSSVIGALYVAFPSKNIHGDLGTALYDLLTAIWDPNMSVLVQGSNRKGKKSSPSSNGGCINPHHFFQTFSSRYAFFEANEQQDSHDFLRLLFNALDDEFDQAGGGKKTQPPIHRSIFAGSISVTVDCRKCGEKTVQQEPCLDLSLAIKKSSLQRDTEGPLEEQFEALSIETKSKSREKASNRRDSIHSIRQLIAAWMEPQELQGENAFACESCFKRLAKPKESSDPCIDASRKVVYSPATCRHQVTTPPSSFIIHLQRFSLKASEGTRRRGKRSLSYAKDHTPIHIDPEIGMCRQRYRLQAIIVHEGASAESGHYTAFVKGPPSEGGTEEAWFFVSDSSVSNVSSETVCSCTNPYILFYQAIP